MRSASRRLSVCLAIPAFDRMAGLSNTPYTLAGDYTYTKDFNSRLKA